MPRAGQLARDSEGGLEDRVSVGVLAKAFPRGLVDEVIEAAGAREQRRRVLSAWLTLYFTLALALFMDRGAARVMRKLAGVVAWAERGVAVTVPAGPGQPLKLPGRGRASARSGRVERPRGDQARQLVA